MGKKSGSNRLKRQIMPVFWQVPRKAYRFAVRPAAGPHPIDRCYPLGILLRDVLKVAKNMREVEKILHNGYVYVDNVKRFDVNFPLGLMGVVELQPLKKVYRLVPKDGFILKPIEIVEGEKGMKICKVINKSTVNGGKIQYTLHDGRNILVDGSSSSKLDGIRVNDSILISIPEQEVKDVVKIERDALAIIIAGENAGTIGRVMEVKEGTITLSKRVILESSTKEKLEIPVGIVMTIGREKPLLNIG